MSSKTTWFIEARVIHTWKPSNVGFGEPLKIIFADKKKFESIPTDTIWLLEVAGDLEKSDGRTKIQDTRRHKKIKIGPMRDCL
ncbi:unnamed protein product [Brassica rapa]|uniref:DUF223 domain-containing protein n=1 Tax=Brassica campestris TaxID=3711 RepID=A0A8D9LXH6_BRACM|nr:unnamed protein product [Brassica rapa]